MNVTINSAAGGTLRYNKDQFRAILQYLIAADELRLRAMGVQL